MIDHRTRDPRMAWPTGHHPASAIVFVHHEVAIDAAPDRVWSLLVDCTRWPQWYAHAADVSVLTGGPGLRAQARFRFRTLGRYFEPVVAVFEPVERLAWVAKGPAGTSGAHAWRIERTASGCRVITEEAQRGLLLRLAGSRVRRQLLIMHEDWLQSLKRLAEGDRRDRGGGAAG